MIKVYQWCAEWVGRWAIEFYPLIVSFVVMKPLLRGRWRRLRVIFKERWIDLFRGCSTVSNLFTWKTTKEVQRETITSNVRNRILYYLLLLHVVPSIIRSWLKRNMAYKEAQGHNYYGGGGEHIPLDYFLELQVDLLITWLALWSSH
jgi:hypothetical protein